MFICLSFGNTAVEVKMYLYCLFINFVILVDNIVFITTLGCNNQVPSKCLACCLWMWYCCKMGVQIVVVIILINVKVCVLFVCYALTGYVWFGNSYSLILAKIYTYKSERNRKKLIFKAYIDYKRKDYGIRMWVSNFIRAWKQCSPPSQHPTVTFPTKTHLPTDNEGIN